MEIWRLIDLGKAEPYMAQTFYEAVAQAVDDDDSPNTVILVQPAAPYVCLGFHQELEKEIDVDYCGEHGLPIIRRSQGGGATYLDGDQLFYQVVARRESEAIPESVEALFERLLAVTVHVYRELGLPAEFKALNDVIVNGRKISGNGAGAYGEGTTILVGNVILDLDYDSMARVLKVPDEKFRDKMAKSMRDWVTSIRRELGHTPPVERLKEMLAEGYEKVLGIAFERSDPTDLERRIWKEQVRPRHLSHEWLHMPEMRRLPPEGRAIKVADGVRIVEASHKAGKLIRVRAELIGDLILDLQVTGDFFMLPEDAVPDLEASLRRARLDRDEILERIEGFYRERKVETPGIAPGDFTDAVMKLRELAETYQPAVYPYKRGERRGVRA
ncbi:hypothetical protein AC482_00585 [miscellaneous Crenarchaeota group-15 archaeon DG-45]|uniref:BPL/LPL catalytic domain-containing protein n=1 Tax=miscellaneous Crenarchaeota group-15 archaeon DG-45 TaxID=1685127 RepID=A0A0M0BSW5_9ARCH|nr:MAG: hypothetical protein AC482_00585 [miscellaneous Crenarchaeota group-15 archaeon DG-45]